MASAQTPQPSETTSTQSPPFGAPSSPSDEGLIDATRGKVRSSVEWLASGVDGWFGDIPFSEGGKVSEGELGLNVYKRQDQSATTGVRFKARFRLPNLESYQYLFVGNDDRSQIVSDQPDTFSRQQQLLRGGNRDNAFFAGIGATLRDSVDLRLGFRGGLKPYAQARYHQPWLLSTVDRIDFRETLFYSSDDKLGSTTALSYERTLTSTLVARWLNSATVTRETKDVAWSSSWGTYKSYGGQRLLSLEALLGGVIGDPVTVADYGVQAKWSQPIYKDFLIGELILGTFWPRPDVTLPREQAWAIGTGIKLRF
ncbi:hypothetical protein [Aquabacterium sp.]|uniref:hypothetical protein n=1 Tax=Aquabacterium sp. TaxID=1872578 RepID=UPI002489FF62|nr:hypothetical protein [Aquabacterium sp.]MDI1260376.1 hypothetical protein [Aquabacterium sp.]